ncbi:hypothetical protein [Aureimonas sp. Leaf324]|uniref:hypothetical protein n=1 Tax=Aureimonas sp. Leaf324 TaxID=1736336 RepID=UPI0012E1651F|nr:hypothetical protein [Aureimonas sp. Leaf324]
MKAVITGVALALSASAAGAQEAAPQITPSMSQKETFKAIGARLEAIQKSLKSSNRGNLFGEDNGTTANSVSDPGKMMPAEPGKSAFQTIVIKPTENSEQTKDAIAGAVKGLSEAASKSGGNFTGVVTTNIENVASTFSISDVLGFEDAMEMMADLGQQLKGNPYVGLKGFTVSIGLPPSLDAEFEMKPEPTTPASLSEATPKP